MKRKKEFSSYQKIILIMIILAVIFFELYNFHIIENIKDREMIKNLLLRFSAGALLVIALSALGYKDIFKVKNLRKSLLIIIPALIVSLNNFPIIAFFDGRAVLTEPSYRIFLFLIECLSVGFFEEILFRGILLIILIQSFNHHKYGTVYAIFLSSAIFGVFHIVNLWNGASVLNTILQIGYSFLVSMMWAVMFLKTKNIWLTMILHATFNFFGQVMFYLGLVDGRYDVITISVTVLFALLAFIYSLKLLKEVMNSPIIGIDNLDTGEDYEI